MTESLTFELEPADSVRLANLCGQFDQHLHQIENRLGVSILCRGNLFTIEGEAGNAGVTSRLIKQLYKSTEGEVLTPESINLHLQDSGVDELRQDTVVEDDDNGIPTKRGLIRGRGPNQKRYIKSTQKYAISFGIGPAGTGKTFLAVACAVKALQTNQVQRIVLVRPAVEAGERLGFLPGDMAQKVDPYLRPLYDALYEMLGFDQVARLIERNVIEVAPLAFMRGRSLNDSFVILDEAQNTTPEQMKMFLTRIGFGSTAVVTGDITQIDLPVHQLSGLKQSRKILKSVDGISFTYFDSRDVVRHPMVQRIIEAYARAGQDKSGKKSGVIEIVVQRATEQPGLPGDADFERWIESVFNNHQDNISITVRLVDTQESQLLNQRFRQQDKATNVLSFPADIPAGLDLPDIGDIIICAPLVEQEAQQQGKQSFHHWAHLTVHGVLHLLGYDHITGKQASIMEGKEKFILAQLGVSDPYA